jgi:hypothetical protein
MMIGAKPMLEVAVGLNRFMHIETFGRSPRRGGRKWRDVAEILGEAAQGPGGAAGLAEPKPPELYFGATPQSLAPEAQRLASAAVDSLGRKLGGDAAVLVAGVASFPAEHRIFERDLIERETYNFWSVRVLRWLQDTFGASLKCVVERHDENTRSLHFFTLPSLTDDSRLDWRRAHPGLAAKRRAEQAGANKREQEREYRSAMRRMDDQFQEVVINGLGRDRFGPGRGMGARRERPAGAKTERIKARTNERERILEAKVAKISAELEAERNQSRIRQRQLDQALESLAASQRHARQAEEEVTRLRAASK